MKGFDGLESLVYKQFGNADMRRLTVVFCAVAGLVVTSSRIANAAASTIVAERQIRIPVKQDPDDDWIPWDRVIGVFKSRQECTNAGQALADTTRGQYHCQKAKSTAWVLFK
jgi:hypothetical protein